MTSGNQTVMQGPRRGPHYLRWAALSRCLPYPCMPLKNNLSNKQSNWDHVYTQTNHCTVPDILNPEYFIYQNFCTLVSQKIHMHLILTWKITIQMSSGDLELYKLQTSMWEGKGGVARHHWHSHNSNVSSENMVASCVSSVKCVNR